MLYSIVKSGLFHSFRGVVHQLIRSKVRLIPSLIKARGGNGPKMYNRRRDFSFPYRHHFEKKIHLNIIKKGLYKLQNNS